jgi:hypothetical protein
MWKCMLKRKVILNFKDVLHGRDKEVPVAKG